MMKLQCVENVPLTFKLHDAVNKHLDQELPLDANIEVFSAYPFEVGTIRKWLSKIRDEITAPYRDAEYDYLEYINYMDTSHAARSLALDRVKWYDLAKAKPSEMRVSVLVDSVECSLEEAEGFLAGVEQIHSCWNDLRAGKSRFEPQIRGLVMNEAYLPVLYGLLLYREFFGRLPISSYDELNG